MKKILSKSDLAINGAPPAFEQPLHVGRPSIGSREQFKKRIDAIFDNYWLTNNGPMVQELEARVAAHLGAKHCVAICNGTIALEIAIRALGLEGEVIIPSFTFIATAHALQWQGITPVFADIDPATHNLDPNSVRRMITPRTTGILGVHLWGRAAPHAELQAIADEHGLKLMYDAAHAFGCSLRGTMIGNLGACEVLSFHATKFFNSFEGGAVITNNDALAEKMRLTRNFGFAGVDCVNHLGTNGKMTEVCAAMGLTNLDSIEQVVYTNRSSYLAYQAALSEIKGLRLLSFDEREKNNYQYCVLEVGHDFPVRRDEIVATLQAENILARKYFWPGCHRMGPYRDLYPWADTLLPNTKALAEQVIVLPAGSAASKDDVDSIAAVLRCLTESASS